MTKISSSVGRRHIATQLDHPSAMVDSGHQRTANQSVSSSEMDTGLPAQPATETQPVINTHTAQKRLGLDGPMTPTDALSAESAGETNQETFSPFDLHTSQLSTQPSRVEQATSGIPQSAQRFFFDSQELRKVAKEFAPDSTRSLYIGDVANKYAFSIDYPGKHKKRNETMFRGMAFGDISMLETILKEGFKGNSSRHRKTYFDNTPTTINYALNPDNGSALGGRCKNNLHVLFELDYSKMPKMRKSARIGYATTKDVPPEAIRFLHIFDRQATGEFPLSVYSPEEFLSLVGD